MRRCEIGGCYEESEKCHIKARGAGGSNKPHNIIRMCRQHHSEQHTIGLWTFAEKYGLVKRFDEAYEKEAELAAVKRETMIQKIRKPKQRKICPTCKRTWSKGVTEKSKKRGSTIWM